MTSSCCPDRGRSVNYIFNSQQTAHIKPYGWAMGCVLWGLWEKLTIINNSVQCIIKPKVIISYPRTRTLTVVIGMWCTFAIYIWFCGVLVSFPSIIVLDGCMWIIYTYPSGLLLNYTPHFNEVEMGGILVSTCPSVCLSVCPCVDRIMSALYLHQYSSDPFHICTTNQATLESVWHVMFVSKFKYLKFWQILLICNFDFGFFWLGI